MFDELFSFAFPQYQQVLSGTHQVFQVDNSLVQGHYNAVIGNNNMMYGNYCCAYGRDNVIHGQQGITLPLQFAPQPPSRKRARSPSVKPKQKKPPAKKPKIAKPKKEKSAKKPKKPRAPRAKKAKPKEEEEKKTKNSLQCTICLDRPREMAVFPCGHMDMCSTCCTTLCESTRKCPTCRADIRDSKRVFVT